MAALAENFVCVRIQSMNQVNLNQFQFEYDLTWMSFFQNHEGRTYVRYGGREDHSPESHLNKASLMATMYQALLLHQDGAVQPDNRYEPVAQSRHTPEDIPTMKAMMSRRKEKCIHCHDVKVAQLKHLGELGKLEKDMVFTYPTPSRLGIELDPVHQNRVQRVEPQSPAAAAGLAADDVIRSIAGQRVLTLADMTRVLELAPDSGSLEFAIERGDDRRTTSVPLSEGWQKSADPSWRASTGALGPSSGFWGADATESQRRQLGVGPDDLALRITFIWGNWVKEVGLRNGDYVLAIGEKKSRMTIRQLQAYLHLNRNWGESVELTIRRDGRDRKVTLQFPDEPPQ